MEIIDGQLHDIGPRRQWGTIDRATRHGVLTELMLAWMDAVGVDKALIFPTDVEWAKAAIQEHPDTFAGVYRVKDPEAADVDAQVKDAKTWPGSLGLRLSFGRVPVDPDGAKGSAKFKSGAFDGFFKACEDNGVPLFCSAYGYPHHVGEIAQRHPKLQLIVDHMGIAQPPLNPRETPPWKSLDDLLPLGRLPNVAVKLCGAPVLSEEGYPFSDVWEPMRRMLDAFGADRLLWASDIGRFEGRIGWDNHYAEAHEAYKGKHNYAESLFFILHSDQLSQDEKRKILGGNVRKILKWNP